MNHHNSANLSPKPRLEHSEAPRLSTLVFPKAVIKSTSLEN
jgi:hypothetical protein